MEHFVALLKKFATECNKLPTNIPLPVTLHFLLHQRDDSLSQRLIRCDPINQPIGSLLQERIRLQLEIEIDIDSQFAKKGTNDPLKELIDR